MKPIIPFALLGALLAVGANAQSVTKPVGYSALGDTVNLSAVAANTDVAISIPLHRVTEFAGSIATAAAGSVTLEGTPGLTDDQFAPATGAPYIFVVTSGAAEGTMGLITANGADSIDFTTVNGGDVSTAAAGDTVIVFESWTLANLLPSDTPAGTRVLAFSGAVAGENLAADLQFVYNGTDWIQLVGGSGPANDTVLYLGESFIVRAAANPVASFVATGEVPTFNHQIDIAKLGAGNQDNRVGYIGPVDEIIGESGLGFTAGDRLLSFDNEATGLNKAANEILVYNGTGWIGLVGVSGDVTNTYAIEGGKGYVYRRVGTAPVGDVVWNDEQTYISSL